VPDSFRQANACRRSPPGRLSRAARLAAGAALIGVQATCASSAYGTSPPYDAAVADTSTADGNTNDSAVALYGAAPAQLEQAPPASDGTSTPDPEKK
jgi:hypothetical protein